jgi:hypothetical protein
MKGFQATGEASSDDESDDKIIILILGLYEGLSIYASSPQNRTSNTSKF